MILDAKFGDSSLFIGDNEKKSSIAARIYWSKEAAISTKFYKINVKNFLRILKKASIMKSCLDKSVEFCGFFSD